MDGGDGPIPIRWYSSMTLRKDISGAASRPADAVASPAGRAHRATDASAHGAAAPPAVLAADPATICIIFVAVALIFDA